MNAPPSFICTRICKTCIGIHANIPQTHENVERQRKLKTSWIRISIKLRSVNYAQCEGTHTKGRLTMRFEQRALGKGVHHMHLWTPLMCLETTPLKGAQPQESPENFVNYRGLTWITGKSSGGWYHAQLSSLLVFVGSHLLKPSMPSSPFPSAECPPLPRSPKSLFLSVHLRTGCGL